MTQRISHAKRSIDTAKLVGIYPLLLCVAIVFKIARPQGSNRAMTLYYRVGTVGLFPAQDSSA